MGYSASAITVIGYRVPREQGIFKHSTPGCKCAIPEELRQSYKFCPSCGKPATVVVSERLEERWPHRDTPVNSNSSEGGDFYVGLVSNDSGNSPAVRSVDIDFKTLATTLKHKLLEVGVSVKDEDFGIHTFLYESY